MSNDRTRRPANPRDRAEALFKAAAPKPPAVATKPKALPGTREMVSLRIDTAVLEHFQSGGPGWQDRINDALRQVADIGGGDEGLTPDELNSSNDG